MPSSSPSAPVPVILYTRVGCHLCDVVKETLEAAQTERAFALSVVDIDTDPALRALYTDEVPVVMVAGRKAFKYRMTREAFFDKLDRAAP